MDVINPIEPRKLLMAYEEGETVKPVVSDFDPFLVGSQVYRSSLWSGRLRALVNF